MDRRNALLVALGVVVVVAAVVVVAVVAGGGDDDDVTVGDDETTTTVEDTSTTETTEATTTTETTAPADGAGEPIVAVDAEGRLVVLADDGTVDRVLLEGIAVDDPTDNAVAVVPGGESVFVTRPGTGGEDTELLRVALDGGGEPEVLGQGIAPSVSPDGSRLAYVRFVEDGPLPAPALVVRDLDSGEEQELRRETEPGLQFIADTAWTADGEQIAFIAGEIQTGLYLVDPDAGTLDDASRVGPTAAEEGTSWIAVAAFGEDRLAVVETCCDVGEKQRWLVLAVNITEAEAEGGLLPGDRTEASVLDSPAGEERLLYVTDLRPGGGTLHRWDGSGEPEVVSEGIVVASW